MRLFVVLRGIVCRRPGLVVGGWALLAVVVALTSPDLTRLTSEGQARILGRSAESRRAAEIVRRAWPDQSHVSLAIAVLHREGGLTQADRDYRLKVADHFAEADRPRPILRVLGPRSQAEIAERLTSVDGTVALVAVPLRTPFVSPVTQAAVAWLQDSTTSRLVPPPGLDVSWTGDAVIGRDFMRAIRTSLDRAAIATVVLLLAVLWYVYRSVWLALVPLATIGVSLVVSRGMLGWLASAGWDMSPLVELFLVAILFGSGTDFCLFLSWRFAENWDPADPAGAMEKTQSGSCLALFTSAGTVIVGLSLMGTTKFKLFSSTGPSVALGLTLTLLATLTLTPALLVLLARVLPSAFRGMTAPPSRLWERIGARAMARPLLSWGATMLVMGPLALVGLRTTVVHDLLTEIPGGTPSAQSFRLLASKFEQGSLAPLTVVLESQSDFRDSEGLALIDDLSRFLARQKGLTEVRSATQPLGSPRPLAPARIDARLDAVDDGLGQMADGATRLTRGLYEGIAKLRAAIWLEGKTGLSLTPGSPGTDPKDTHNAAGRDAFASAVRGVSAALLNRGPGGNASTPPAADPKSESSPTPKPDDSRQAMLAEIVKAADGASQLAAGAARAKKEVSTVLHDPVGRRALDRLLINDETVKDHPELRRSFYAYITPDGHHARFDLTQSERIFSAGALDQVESLRRRLNEFIETADGPQVNVWLAGANAESADVRELTRVDQFRSWFIIPFGVFCVLLVALRDPLACLNLVATMLLTYAFALGATNLLFVGWLGAAGLDWKVPYFLFVLLVAVGVDYNVFLMARLHEESSVRGLRPGIIRAIGQTGGLISSAAAITACSFASFLTSPLGSLRQLGFALVVGIAVDAVLVRPLLVPCGHWLLSRLRTRRRSTTGLAVKGHAQTGPRLSPAGR